MNRQAQEVQHPLSLAALKRITEICDRFEASWNAGTRPDLADFVADCSEAELTPLLSELVILDLANHWRTAQEAHLSSLDQSLRSQDQVDGVLPDRPMLEDYVSRYPRLLANADLPLSVIQEEYRVRHLYGDQPEQQEYRARFPNHAGLLEALDAVDAEIQGEDTALHPGPRAATPRGSLEIRCPHCHNSIEAIVDTPVADVACDACGGTFSLLGEGTDSQRAASVKTMGRFELLARLGVGGFATVWKARDTHLDRTVAVKIPRQGQLTDQEAEQFLREARAAAQLQHPNIVSVHEVGRYEDKIYIVSDVVHGVALSDWITGQHPTPRESAELCSKLAAAVHHAHEQGVIHRDLKPHNILIDQEDEPHVTDFGLAKREAGEVTLTVDGQVMGTPAYMSPEQARGEGHASDRRTDVYSLGVILFQLLTGELPFRGSAPMLIHQVIHDDAPSPRKFNSQISRDLETITLRCLEKEPARRYATAKDFADELTRFGRGEAIEARPIGRLARTWRLIRRKPAVAALSMTLATVICVVAVVAPIIAVQAEQRRKSAEESYDMARWAVDDLVDTVTREQVLNDERLQPLKRALLSDALMFYQDFIERAQNDPDIIHELASALDRVGAIANSIGATEEAVRAFQDAIDLYAAQGARGKSGKRLDTVLMHSYCDLSDLQFLRGEIDAGLNNLELAVAASQRLCNYDTAMSPDSLSLLATSYDSLARRKRQTAQLADANEYSKRSVALRERTLKAAPAMKIHALRLCRSYNYLSIAQKEIGDYEGARQSCDRVFYLLESKLHAAPDEKRYQDWLALHCLNKGLWASSSENAQSYIRRAIAIWDDLVRGEPPATSLRTNLARSYLALGLLLHEHDDPKAARESIEQAIKLQKLLLHEQPMLAKHQADLSWSYKVLGVHQHAEGQAESSKQTFDRAGEMLDLLKENPNKFIDQFLGFINFYSRVIEQTERQIMDNPSNESAKYRLADSLNALARLYTSYNQSTWDPARAISLATRACELLQWKSARHLETLASAYADSGDFKLAMKHQSAALKLLGQHDARTGRIRLELYKLGQNAR